jgi:hypothetical protein
LQAHRLTFPLLVDAKDAVAATYRLVAVPTNAVIGKDGRLRYIGMGFDERELQQAIEAALGEQGAATRSVWGFTRPGSCGILWARRTSPKWRV